MVSIIIFSIIALLLFGYFDFHAGHYLHKKHHKDKHYPIRQGHIQLITTGTELFRHYFKDIKAAENTIHIQFYIVKSDPFSRYFFKLLEEQAAKGVKIHLLLDWLGSRTVPKQWITQAEKQGIEFTYCHRPRIMAPMYSLQQRNHRKITVIDGKIGYLGGYNIGMEYVDRDAKLSPWRDYHLRILGEGAQDLQQEFCLDWHKATGETLHISNQDQAIDSGEMKYQFYPSAGLTLEEKWLTLIQQAKQCISIGTPYFIPPKRLLEALKNALQRGVQVIILVPNTADHPIVKEAAFCYLRPLLALGARIFQFEQGFYHAKIIMIDDQLCSIGTANFDNRSFHLNSEMSCFIYNAAFINQAKKIFTEDLRRSESLTLQGLNQVSWIVRVKEGIGWLIKGLL